MRPVLTAGMAYLELTYSRHNQKNSRNMKSLLCQASPNYDNLMSKEAVNGNLPIRKNFGPEPAEFLYGFHTFLRVGVDFAGPLDAQGIGGRGVRGARLVVMPVN